MLWCDVGVVRDGVSIGSRARRRHSMVLAIHSHGHAMLMVVLRVRVVSSMGKVWMSSWVPEHECQCVLGRHENQCCRGSMAISARAHSALLRSGCRISQGYTTSWSGRRPDQPRQQYCPDLTHPLQACTMPSPPPWLSLFLGPAVLTRFRLLITSVLRLIGRARPWSFKNSPVDTTIRTTLSGSECVKRMGIPFKATYHMHCIGQSHSHRAARVG